MTQFALVSANKKSEVLKSLSINKNDFSIDLCAKLLPNNSIDNIYIIDFCGKSIDELMIDAQKMILKSSSFKETPLYKIIVKLESIVDEFIFWYGSDYEDLDKTFSFQEFISKLEESVRSPMCEFYMSYISPHKEKIYNNKLVDTAENISGE